MPETRYGDESRHAVMVVRDGAAQLSKPMPVKVCGPDAVLTVAVAPVAPLVPVVDAVGAVDVGVPGAVWLDVVAEDVAVAVERTSSIAASLVPQAASTCTSFAVKRATLVR